MKLLERKKRKVIINITSLIDVLFLLLIFFMISSTFLEQPGMKLELPVTKSHSQQQIENLILEMTADEQMFLNSEIVSFNNLEQRFKELLTTAKDKTLILKADKLVSHGTVVKVMDIAKLSGVEKIVIATKIENE